MLLVSSIQAETISSTDLIKQYNGESNFNSAIIIYSVLFFAILLLIFESMSIRAIKRQLENLSGNPAAEEKVTWMALFFRKSSTRDEHLSDHVYDGIQEFDNNPPAWFNWLFYSSIVAAFCYLMYFHVLKIGKLSLDEYKQELSEAQVVIDRAREKGIKLADMPAFTEADKINTGKSIFTANCVACHGDKGQGNVGPNLTDEYWIHGGKYKQVFTTIFNGVPEKGMISWKKSLKPEDIRAVASYVKTLKGTNPSNPKAPQGDKSED